jgi:hypothetical protein
VYRFAQDGGADAQFRHVLFVKDVVGLEVVDLRSIRKDYEGGGGGGERSKPRDGNPSTSKEVF